jgi:hypothetical protein
LILLSIYNPNQRWQEALDLTSVEYKTPFIGIIQTSSEVTQAIMERCITKHNITNSISKLESKRCNVVNNDRLDLNLSVHYNFKYLNWTEEKIDSKGKEKFYPMLPLSVSNYYTKF